MTPLDYLIGNVCLGACILVVLAWIAVLAWPDRPVTQDGNQLITATHNTAMRLESVHDQVHAAYFYVHQPRHWRGIPYHREAAAQFQKMTRAQAQEFLKEFDGQYRIAMRRLENETGVDLGQSGKNQPRNKHYD